MSDDARVIVILVTRYYRYRGVRLLYPTRHTTSLQRPILVVECCDVAETSTNVRII